MPNDYWKKYAYKLEAERDSLRHDVLFWKGCALLIFVSLLGLGGNVWLLT